MSLEEVLRTASFDDLGTVDAASRVRFRSEEARVRGVSELMLAGLVPVRAVALRVLERRPSLVAPEELLRLLCEASEEESSLGVALLPGHSMLCHILLASVFERAPMILSTHRERLPRRLVLGVALLEGTRGRPVPPELSQAVLEGLADRSVDRGLVSNLPITVARSLELVELRLSDAQAIETLAGHFGTAEAWRHALRVRALSRGCQSLFDIEALLRVIPANEVAAILCRGRPFVTDGFQAKRVMTLIAGRRDTPEALLEAGRQALGSATGGDPALSSHATTVGELFITLGIEALRAERRGIPAGIDNQTAKRFRSAFRLGDWVP